MKRLLPLALAWILTLALLPACSAPQSAFVENGCVKIAATLFPQYDFARVIGGERVQIVKLLPPGTESHTYEPTAKDIVTVADADLFLYTGPDMEPWAQTILDGCDNPPPAPDLSSCLGEENTASQEDHDHEHDHSHTEANDPHIWTSPKKAKEMVLAIQNALIRIDPEGKELYEANGKAYLEALDRLDQELSSLADASKGKSLVFGGRFAFAHLCLDYGFSHISAYRGCDVEAEPSAADIAAVIDLVREKQIGFIFREEYVNPQSVNAIAAETDAEILLLHSCHNVTAADLEAGASYLSLMKQNLENLKKALL